MPLLTAVWPKQKAIMRNDGQKCRKNWQLERVKTTANNDYADEDSIQATKPFCYYHFGPIRYPTF